MEGTDYPKFAARVTSHIPDWNWSKLSSSWTKRISF
jgi:hypothetical protein